MADDRTFDIGEHPDRFKFNLERWVQGRKIVGVIVAKDKVVLSLEGESAVQFSVDGPDIVVSFPESCSTLNVEEPARLM